MLKNLVEKTKTEVTRKKYGNKFKFENIVSIWSLKKAPTRPAGIEATMIYLRF